MKFRLLAILASAGLVTAIAQQNGNPAPPAADQASQATPRATDQENRTHFWDCTAPGGNYTVSLGSITSVSVHEFSVTGGRVTELNVDTSGSVCARFYFMEPVKAGSALSATELVKERATEVADTLAERTGTEKTWRKVVKDYPLATHAHTVEYRLQFKEDVSAIHSSVKSAWMSGRGRSIVVVEGKQ
jgi:hypothetical protein